MFGFRPDGRRVKKMDPIVKITPYVMPQRCDAQVFLDQSLDYEVLARYIAKQAQQGHSITFMELVIAAYVRAVSQYPEVNRFIINKQIFSRKELATAFTMLRDTSDNSIEETTAKIKFDPTDTIFDVEQRVKKAINENRGEETSNLVLKLAGAIISLPIIPTVIVGLIKLLDRYGLLPKFLIDVLPFHTGMYITNMASIGMHRVYHHIYNFGNTSMFLSIGTVERTITMDADGKIVRKRLLPIGITADERVCAGAMYAKLFSLMLHHLNHPELLEKPPEAVRYDVGCEYHVEKPSQKPDLQPLNTSAGVQEA